jgi:hypothetical protein
VQRSYWRSPYAGDGVFQLKENPVSQKLYVQLGKFIVGAEGAYPATLAFILAMTVLMRYLW